MPRKALRAVAALVLLAASDTAAAQTRPGVDLRTFRPAADPRAAMILEQPSTLRAGVVGVGAWLSYGAAALTLRREDDRVYARPVTHQLTLDLQATLGIGERVAAEVGVPLSAQASGNAALPEEVSTSPKVAAFALGDPWLGAKIRLRDNAAGGLGLAIRAGVTLPFGNRNAFTGERSVRPEATLIADYSLLVGGLQAQLGARGRTVFPEWPAGSGLRFGHELPWAIGAWFDPSTLKLDSNRRQRWEIAFRGAIPFGPQYPFGAGSIGSAARAPILLSLSDRIEVGTARDFSLVAGVDIGLTAAAGVPALRVVAGLRYAPALNDVDGDGIRDAVDQCPDVAEDHDGFEDDDGCPDIDDDKDDIPDKVDACPRVAGSASKNPKQNGCVPVDSDGDGIPDELDLCPRERGLETELAGCNGCPDRDPDGDGLEAPADRCPNEAEDVDGFQDADGCPDPDNDSDGIEDPVDACLNIRGTASSNPKLNGCPSQDRDGDTIANDQDRCPDAAEAWNGISDEDGCPETTPAFAVLSDLPPLNTTSSTIESRNSLIKLTHNWMFDAASAEWTPAGASASKLHMREITLRAIATLANAQPEAELQIVVPPLAGDGDGKRALARQMHLMTALQPLLSEAAAVAFVIELPTRSRRQIPARASDISFWLPRPKPAARTSPNGNSSPPAAPQATP